MKPRRRPHWMGEHDYARDLASEEREEAMSAREYEDERRQRGDTEERGTR